MLAPALLGFVAKYLGINYVFLQNIYFSKNQKNEESLRKIYPLPPGLGAFPVVSAALRLSGISVDSLEDL